MSKILTLFVAHNLHLDKEERYAIHDGITINTIGTCVPVWVYNGLSSEPAEEIFCNYNIIPSDQEKIDILYDFGFNINILKYTKKEDTVMLSLPDEDWKRMSHIEQSIWYSFARPPIHPTTRNLLNIEDGGSSWCSFQCRCKEIICNKLVHVIHNVIINDETSWAVS